MSDIDELRSDVDLVLDGMSCRLCVRRVEEALSAINGVASVQARIGSAHIRYIPEVAPLRVLRDRLARLGYPVVKPRLRGPLGWLARVAARRRLGSEALRCCTHYSEHRSTLPS